MSNPSMYETVSDIPVVKEELTLELVNSKIDSLTDAINHMYGVFQKSIEQKFMYEAQRDKLQESNTAQAFYSTSVSIAALNAKIETLVNFAVGQGLNREAYDKESFDTAQAVIKENDAQVQAFYEKQLAEQRVANEPSSNLTEAGE